MANRKQLRLKQRMFYIDSVYSTVLKIYVPNADYIKTYKKNSIQRTEEQKLHGREEKKKKNR